MITIATDLYYGDDVDPTTGDDEVRRIVRAHGGLVTYFQLRGPGGGNPTYVFELSDDRAAAFWLELDVDGDLADHVRPAKFGDFYR